jgi:hypothetical protein
MARCLWAASAARWKQGVDLVWNLESSLSVVVIDIHEDIDGVLGSDLLTSGWFSGLFDEEQEELIGPLQQVHFDFRQLFETDDTGKIYFDLTPSFDVVLTPTPGDYNNDGIVDAADYNVWRDSLGMTSAGLAADGNNDGKVDQEDYLVWKNHFGQGAGSDAGSIAVPEPGGLALALVAMLIALTSPARSASSLRCASSST